MEEDQEDREEREYDEQQEALHRVYALVLSGGGYATINQRYIEDANTLQRVRRLKAVPVTPEIKDMYDKHRSWNKMCDLICRLCEVRYYKEWLYDENHSLKGFLVLKEHEGEEIKTKYFNQWKKLLKLVERTGRGRDGKKLVKREATLPRD